MAFRPLLRQRAVVPTTSAILAAGLSLYPFRDVHAETPEAVESPFASVPGPVPSLRKPIYDDFAPVAVEPADPLDAAPSTPMPTYTDRLTAHVARVRLFAHGYAAASEDRVNEVLTEALRLENSFTSTIASLAPPRESGEQVMPGAIYVLVSAMAGSIVTRNRNVLLRGSVPVAVGIAASYAILPLTSRNVGDLIWTYEERYPVIAGNHLRLKQGATSLVQTGIAHSKMTVALLEEKIGSTREAVQEWVKKGK